MAENKSSAHKQQQLMQLVVVDDNNNQGNKNAAAAAAASPIISHGQQTSVKCPTSSSSTILIAKQQPMANITNCESSHSVESTPPSPKAKSAPATPCNITPIAFHQHAANNNGSHYLNLSLNPSPANTMPPDIRKNISATCRLLPSSIRQTSNNQPLVSTATAVSSIKQPPTAQQQQANLSPKPAAAVQQASNNGGPSTTSSVRYLDELLKRGEAAFEAKEFKEAIQVFGQCIELAKSSLSEKQNLHYLKENFRIYSLRAEAHFNLANYSEAIEDSIAARDLNPKWTQAYYLQGRSQFILKQFADSLAVFSFGLAQDPTNKRLLEALVDSALKSNFKQEFQLEYESLKALGHDKKPYVVVSILGQELLAKGHGEHAAIVLESALKMFNQTTALDSGGDSQNATAIRKYKGSVLSTLALAYCLMKDYEKAINYMQRELEIESELEDIAGQCRVLYNLGRTYFKMRKFDKSLEVHRRQNQLALRTRLFQQASLALNALGHVHSARLDYANALVSHTRSLDILRELGDNHLSQFRELLSIGHIHSLLNDYKATEEKYSEARDLLKQASGASKSTSKQQEELKVCLIKLKFNMAYLALRKQNHQEAVQLYGDIMQLTQKISAPRRLLYEMRAANGMGQAYRLSKDFDEARHWFEKQLQLAKQLQSEHQFNDEVSQSQALTNLAMAYQHFKDHQTAGRLFDENMRLVDENRNPLLKAYAHSYLASWFFLNGRLNDAQLHYESSSNLFKDLQFCSSERKTIDLNMALVYERMGGGYSNSELQQPQAAAAQQPSNNNDQQASANSQQQQIGLSISNNNTSPLVISSNSINLTPTTNNSATNSTNAQTVGGNPSVVQLPATPQSQSAQKKVMMAA